MAQYWVLVVLLGICLASQVDCKPLQWKSIARWLPKRDPCRKLCESVNRFFCVYDEKTKKYTTVAGECDLERYNKCHNYNYKVVPRRRCEAYFGDRIVYQNHFFG